MTDNDRAIFFRELLTREGAVIFISIFPDSTTVTALSVDYQMFCYVMPRKIWARQGDRTTLSLALKSF